MSTGDNRVRCPGCAKSLGRLTREGDVSVRLSITLVKSDGTVHGPCSECGADVIVAMGGAPSEPVKKALTTPETPKSARAGGRLVLDLRPGGGLTGDEAPR